MGNNEVNILPPQLSGESSAVGVLWGEFDGPREKIAGAFYLEITPERAKPRAFNLALFDSSSALDEIQLVREPLKYQQQVKKKEGFHGDITKSGFRLAVESIQEFIGEGNNKDALSSALKERDESQLFDLVQEMISRLIRKGATNFDIFGQALSPQALRKTLGPDEPEGEVEFEDAGSGERRDKKSDRNYHRVSIVTIPLKGADPGDLMPGDEIYARLVGDVVQQLPKELHSEKYDKTSVPLESVVESVEKTPDLPPDFDGNPEDYRSITVSLPGDMYGRGFVFKDETVKAKNVSNVSSASTKDPYIISGMLFAIGIILFSIVGIAYYLFG